MNTRSKHWRFLLTVACCWLVENAESYACGRFPESLKTFMTRWRCSDPACVRQQRLLPVALDVVELEDLSAKAIATPQSRLLHATCDGVIREGTTENKS